MGNGNEIRTDVELPHIVQYRATRLAAKHEDVSVVAGEHGGFRASRGAIGGCDLLPRSRIYDVWMKKERLRS